MTNTSMGDPGPSQKPNGVETDNAVVPPVDALTFPSTLPTAGLARRARRLAGLSQRELAARSGVGKTTVSRVESGRLMPRVDTLERILGVARLRLVVIDEDRRVVLPMRVWDGTTDGAGRRYPAHLDTILDPFPGEWWADIYGLARPPETFHRDPFRREAQRRRSVWEVRVAQHRNEPPPPELPRVERARRDRWRRTA